MVGAAAGGHQRPAGMASSPRFPVRAARAVVAAPRSPCSDRYGPSTARSRGRVTRCRANHDSAARGSPGGTASIGALRCTGTATVHPPHPTPGGSQAHARGGPIEQETPLPFLILPVPSNPNPSLNRMCRIRVCRILSEHVKSGCVCMCRLCPLWGGHGTHIHTV